MTLTFDTGLRGPGARDLAGRGARLGRPGGQRHERRAGRAGARPRRSSSTAPRCGCPRRRTGCPPTSCTTSATSTSWRRWPPTPRPGGRPRVGPVFGRLLLEIVCAAYTAAARPANPRRSLHGPRDRTPHQLWTEGPADGLRDGSGARVPARLRCVDVASLDDVRTLIPLDNGLASVAIPPQRRLAAGHRGQRGRRPPPGRRPARSPPSWRAGAHPQARPAASRPPGHADLAGRVGLGDGRGHGRAVRARRPAARRRRRGPAAAAPRDLSPPRAAPTRTGPSTTG